MRDAPPARAPGRPLADRFRAGVGPPDPATGCRRWTGRANCGTGYVRGGGAGGGAVRRVGGAAWEPAHGPIPAGMAVVQTCRDRTRVEGAHPVLGTAAEARGYLRRGHPPYAPPVPPHPGETHPNARLTWATVREMRRRHAEENHRGLVADLARECSVGSGTVSSAIGGRTWRDDPDEPHGS